MYKAYRVDEGLNDVDLLQRGHNQQLQVEFGEQPQAVLSRFVRAAAEGFVDHHEAESARSHRTPLQPELVRKARRENGVGEFLLLAA